MNTCALTTLLAFLLAFLTLLLGIYALVLFYGFICAFITRLRRRLAHNQRKTGPEL